MTAGKLIPFRVGAFRLRIDPDMDRNWLEGVIAHPDQVPVARHLPSRRSGFLPYPAGVPCDRVFVKWYAATDTGHGSAAKRLAIHRLRPRYAAREGTAGAVYAGLGIPVARVLAWGEEWKWGIRHRGILVQEALDCENVQVVLARTREPVWIQRAFHLITRLHRAGYTHGDANLVNFLAADDGRIIPIDLENVRKITRKKRSSDLVNVMKSAYIALETAAESFIIDGLRAYTDAGLILPEPETVLFDKARKKARKYGGVTL